MKNKQENHKGPENKADRQVPGEKHPSLNSADSEILQLIHELEVHKVELEMQNHEIQQAQEIARANAVKFRTLFDHAPMGYFLLDKNGNICEANFMGATMLGRDHEEIKDSNFKVFIAGSSKQKFNNFVDSIFNNHESRECEIGLSKKTGNPAYIYMKGSVSENPQQCLVAAVDISRRVAAEKALKESESRLRELNATKDKFFSIISHDLKSPFTSIIGLSNLLLGKVKSKDYEDIEEYAEYIKVSSFRAMDLLNNLLEWSSAQTGKISFSPEEANINELLSEAIELSMDAARQKSISIRRIVPQKVIGFADKTMISTVLRNLITNAIKFTHPRGSITVSAKHRGDEILVSVSDTGVGIKQDIREKIFDVDRGRSTMGTGNEPGTGLGLLLVKEFIEIHGGRIWVESEPGEGSTFFFTIP